jgi:hypothetical protein
MVRLFRTGRCGLLVTALVAGVLVTVAPAVGAEQAQTTRRPADASISGPTFGSAVAFDRSPSLRTLAEQTAGEAVAPYSPPAERGPAPTSTSFTGDGAVQRTASTPRAVSDPIVSFEGLSNDDNPFRVVPPDPIGDVGPHHYVEMVNVTWAVYDKAGTMLLGPLRLGTLWHDFAVHDCKSTSGDPVVLHDQLADRWILTQFTTAGPNYYNCVAVSATSDPTGEYYRYAFSTGPNFPDYPKYGVWPDAYFLSTREFAPDDSFAGVGAYALERAAMIAGDPAARMVSFLLRPDDRPYLPGDGLLPSDLDGDRLPPAGSPNFFVGTQDDQGPYDAPFDAINMWEYRVDWTTPPRASFQRTAQLPVKEFDSNFSCRHTPETSRACIAQRGTDQRIDVLSYRQRPTWRLAYRNFGDHEALVTNQSVETRTTIAGVRWYEIRSPGHNPVVYQQSTFSPDDGISRWMGSAAQDRFGNMALGYSVSSSFIYPGIRYTGRLAGDVLNRMTQGEGVLINGGGSQLGATRWGDYTSLNVDPTDDCTFWYVNEYYPRSSNVRWHTRIGSFQLPGCGDNQP